MNFYLDDGAMVLTNPRQSCPKLVKLLELAENAMNLKPKLPKTQVMPLWDGDMASAKSFFSDCCPYFLDANFTPNPLFLGIVLGVDGHILTWERIKPKLLRTFWTLLQ